MADQAQQDLAAQLNQIDPDKETQNNDDMPPENEDLPQEITESYGTGVKDPTGYYMDEVNIDDELSGNTSTGPEITGGDVYAFVDDAETVGDEAPGGTAPTPDQNVTEDIEAAVGLPMDDFAFLRTQDILEERDDRRWELDPMSSEDYGERRNDEDEL